MKLRDCSVKLDETEVSYALCVIGALRHITLMAKLLVDLKVHGRGEGVYKVMLP